MTFRVPRSRLTDYDAFDHAVKSYCNQLTAHTKTVGKPRPSAHPLIEQSVRRIQEKGKPDRFVPDYELYSDEPIIVEPQPSFEEKKRQLFFKLEQAEMVAKHKVLPAGKNRLYIIKYNKAMSVLEADRTPEQRKFVDEFHSICDRMQKIELLAAQTQSDIEDPTETTLEHYKLPDFDHV